ncbi:MAG: PRC-barrel domain-containing protein [Bacteroidia bacterium]
MIHPVKNLIGLKIHAIDGEIGKVTDFYFDNVTYTVRYLVVETGSFLFSREIMLSTQSLVPSDFEKEGFMTNLTIQQIENCPHADTKRRIADVEEEVRLLTYYKLKNYRNIFDVAVETAVTEKHPASLHSVNEITEMEVSCTDANVGKVRDVLVDGKSWKINHLIVDAFKISGKEVLIPTSSLSELKPNNSFLLVNLSSEEIANKPEYFSDQLIDMDGVKKK